MVLEFSSGVPMAMNFKNAKQRTSFLLLLWKLMANSVFVIDRLVQISSRPKREASRQT